MSRGTWFGVAVAVLAAGAAVLVLHGEMLTIDPWYVVLLLVCTGLASFTVGYVAGFLSEGGFGPPPGGME